MKKHNFNAGPSIVPEITIKKTAENILDLNGIGLSLMEISHRSKEYSSINEEAQSLLKEILDVPAGYAVLFLQGGASLQFCMVPYNLLNKKAAYLETGSWAKKAIKEGKLFGPVDVVASSADKNYTYIPKNYTIPADADYFHITTNNTIFGTEIERKIPTMLDYRTHIEGNSLFNTPACVTVFACVQTMKWLKNLGGLKAMHKINIEKATLLYNEIDRSRLFIHTVPNEEDRSIMNVTFVMHENYKELEGEFLEFASSKGMFGFKDTRSGGS